METGGRDPARRGARPVESRLAQITSNRGVLDRRPERYARPGDQPWQRRASDYGCVRLVGTVSLDRQPSAALRTVLSSGSAQTIPCQIETPSKTIDRD